jgi:hypothetical protein
MKTQLKFWGLLALVAVIGFAMAACDEPEDGTEQTGTHGDFGWSYYSYVGKVEIVSYTGSGGNVTIPEKINGKTVGSIRHTAFRDKGLTSVTIPNSVTIIGSEAFLNNQLTSVTIPDSVTKIGTAAFFDNPLTSVTIPYKVELDYYGGRGPFPGNFSEAYYGVAGAYTGGAAGTYTRPDATDTTWTKQ